MIVEDEPLIALEIMAGLESAGVDVEGPVGSVEDALRAIDDDGSFDGVLDVRPCPKASANPRCCQSPLPKSNYYKP